MFHYTPAPPKAHPQKINGLARYVANVFPPYCSSWVWQSCNRRRMRNLCFLVVAAAALALLVGAAGIAAGAPADARLPGSAGRPGGREGGVTENLVLSVSDRLLPALVPVPPVSCRWTVVPSGSVVRPPPATRSPGQNGSSSAFLENWISIRRSPSRRAKWPSSMGNRSMRGSLSSPSGNRAAGLSGSG